MELLSQPELTVSRIVLACHVPAGSNANIHLNRPSHGFAIRISGKYIYHFSDGRSMVSGQGEDDLIYLPKYSSYKVDALEPGECYAINFDLAEDLHCQPFVRTLRDPGTLLEHFRAAHRTWRKQNPGYREACLSRLYAILAELLSQPKEDDRLAPAISYIHEHYAQENISIPHLAELCGISEAWLRQLFHRVYGQTPVQYIRRLRLNRAAELINSGMYTVQDAASQSGFLDDSYFSREFKKTFRRSPREYKSRTE